MEGTHITGFHGTLESKAALIVKSRSFFISRKDREWLGNGVYFFAHKAHAKNWASKESKKPKNIGLTPCVIEARIDCPDEFFFDIDDPEKLHTLNLLTKLTLENGSIAFSTQYEMWCYSCNLLQKQFPELRVLAYTFNYNIYGASEFYGRQRQYCVTSNNYFIGL